MSLLLSENPSVLDCITEWWVNVPKEGTGGGVDFDTYSSLYEKLYFHLVPPSKWTDTLDSAITTEWLGLERHGLSYLNKSDFPEAMLRIVVLYSGATSGEELMVFLTTSTKEVIFNLYPPKGQSSSGRTILQGSPRPLGALPLLAKSSREEKVLQAEKWASIEGMLQRIEQRQYKHKVRKVPKKSSKKAAPIVFPPPANPLCCNNSWCSQYYITEHSNTVSHHCRSYPCGRMQDPEHMLHFHHTPLNHAVVARPPTAELVQFGFEKQRTPRDILLKKVRQTQKFLLVVKPKS